MDNFNPKINPNVAISVIVLVLGLGLIIGGFELVAFFHFIFKFW